MRNLVAGQMGKAYGPGRVSRCKENSMHQMAKASGLKKSDMIASPIKSPLGLHGP
jgi:hypothetical protein